MPRETPATWRPSFILLTCEHGGRDVPAPYVDLFRGAEADLATHRGSDIGALGVGLRIAARRSAPIIFSTVTRLLVDLNRSLDQPDVFSVYTRDVSETVRASIVGGYYAPYRANVERTIDAALRAGHRVLHVGVHSCTESLNGRTRELEVALLFDEARPYELAFAERWRKALRSAGPNWRCPFNQPYRGDSDGLTTTLRQRLDPARYLGIELEVRQDLVVGTAGQRDVGDRVGAALGDAAAPV